MTQQYWIGDFYIDLSRNQITYHNDTTLLAPKALAVLTYLAQQQGKVVSQDELLSQVWQGTIVTPNTLQRCITQLRKALGDDGKAQDLIKTHAKKGYSLEAEVRWQHETELNSERLTPTATNPVHYATDTHNPNALTTLPALKQNTRVIALACALFVFALLAFQLFAAKPATQLKISEYRPLTATDNKEVAGIYSPDGKYIVFHRYSDEFCRNNIWAKNIETQQEFRLTENLNTNGPHSFSKDGKTLAFIQTVNCTEPITQKTCYHLMSLDFATALQAPQTPKLLLECKNSEIKSPEWLDNEHIALLQKTSERWQLIRYSIHDKSSDVIYQLAEGSIVHYTYSHKDAVLALITQQQDGTFYINRLSINGELLSSYPIQYPPQIARLRAIYPRFSPFEDLLVFSTGRQLFTLSYQGQIKAIDLPIDEPMSSPEFHPDGSRMLVTKGHYDSDITLTPLNSFVSSDQPNSTGKVLARSTQGESHAQFQPQGDLVAFTSSRTGQRQIWLTSATSTRQLSHFPTDAFLYEFLFAKDGQSVLANVDKELIQLHLDGTSQRLAFAAPIKQLFYWDSSAQTALALVEINGVSRFSQLNLVDAAIQVINHHQVKRALKSQDGKLVYTDHMDRFWLSGAVEDEHIAALQGQGSDKQFVIHHNTLYGINEANQLWSYQLNDQIFEILGPVPNNIDNITDVNGVEVLMTLRVRAKKEVVELLLSN